MDSHSNRDWPTVKRRDALPRCRLGAVLLASLLCCASHDAARAAAPYSAQLISARGETIGVVTGRSTSFDAEGRTVGAYAVLSARGYFSDLLPSGPLGQVLSLVYAAPDCSGSAAIEQSSVTGGPLPVPGYVFAFGAPVQNFYVPGNSALRDVAIGSERQRSRDGYTCITSPRRARVYTLNTNNAEVSGFADHYPGPLRVKNIAAVAETLPAQRAPLSPAVVDESAAGADLPPNTPECAPGCLLPYLGDHICESECANSLCGFDAGDCSAAYVARAKKIEAAQCAATCEIESIGDGFCDSACNVSNCGFDAGDCKRP